MLLLRLEAAGAEGLQVAVKAGVPAETAAMAAVAAMAAAAVGAVGAAAHAAAKAIQCLLHSPCVPTAWLVGVVAAAPEAKERR